MRKIVKWSIAIFIFVVVGVGILLFITNYNSFVGCTEEAKSCPGGGGVSRNPELGCEFDPCPELDMTECTIESRNAELCIQVFQPVCGFGNYDLLVDEFSNGCEACKDLNVYYYTEGECPY
jgi:hypothetical protein